MGYDRIETNSLIAPHMATTIKTWYQLRAQKTRLFREVQKRAFFEIGSRVFTGEPEFNQETRQWAIPLFCTVKEQIAREGSPRSILVGEATANEDLSSIKLPSPISVSQNLPDPPSDLSTIYQEYPDSSAVSTIQHLPTVVLLMRLQSLAIRSLNSSLQFLEGSLRLLWLAFRSVILPRSVDNPVAPLPSNLSLSEANRDYWTDYWPLLPRTLLIGYIIWPLITASMISGILYMKGEGVEIISLGVMIGLAVGLTGSVVIGWVLGIVGSTAGGIMIGTGFGVSYALMISRAGGLSIIVSEVSKIKAEFVVIGNIASVVEPPFSAVLLIVVSICMASYLVGSVARTQTTPNYSIGQLIRGGLRGWVFSSLARGVVALGALGLGYILNNDAAFSLVFSVMGGGVLGTAVWRRTRDQKLSIGCGVSYGTLVVGLSTFAFFLMNGTEVGLLMSTMVHAMFHCTFFILAYLTAERISGPLAGALASTLDGAIGYALFVIIYHWP